MGSWKILRHEPLTQVEQILADRPTFAIVGSWDNYRSKQKMQWHEDRREFTHRVRLKHSTTETFCVLLNGRWDQAFGPRLAYDTEWPMRFMAGPASWNLVESWNIGRDETGTGAVARLWEIRLSVDEVMFPSQLLFSRIG